MWSIVLLVFVALYLLPIVLSRTATSTRRTPADLAALSNAIDQFRLDCGRYPKQSEGFSALYDKPVDAKGWNGPYLKMRMPPDVWGFPYHYRCPSPTGRGYQVLSYGADGRPGGTGDDADISNGSDE